VRDLLGVCPKGFTAGGQQTLGLSLPHKHEKGRRSNKKVNR